MMWPRALTTEHNAGVFVKKTKIPIKAGNRVRRHTDKKEFTVSHVSAHGIQLEGEKGLFGEAGFTIVS